MRILTRNIAIREEQNWLETLKNAISDPKILLKTLNLPVDDFAEDIAARKLFAMRVPLPFVEKMENTCRFETTCDKMNEIIYLG